MLYCPCLYENTKESGMFSAHRKLKGAGCEERTFRESTKIQLSLMAVDAENTICLMHWFPCHLSPLAQTIFWIRVLPSHQKSSDSHKSLQFSQLVSSNLTACWSLVRTPRLSFPQDSAPPTKAEVKVLEEVERERFILLQC